MKVAIIFIGTSKYLNFLPSYYEKAEANLFPGVEKQYFVFTDGEMEDLPENITLINQDHLPFPYITLYRFDIINRAMDQLEEYDYLLFMDADTQVVSTVEFEEIFTKDKPLTGVHHPCHALGMPPHNEFPGAFETNPASLCHIKAGEDISVYWQGCVWGGRMDYAKKLVQELDYRVKTDESNGIIAVWHDESQINRYFMDNRELVNTLQPNYAYPESFTAFMETYEPKIVHLAKKNSEYKV
jgi:hypothetical protein